MSDLITGSNLQGTGPGQADSVTPVMRTASKTLVPGDDRVVMADPTSGVLTFTLPDAVSSAGICFLVKRVVNGSNHVAIAAGGSDTIDGVTSDFIIGNVNEWLEVVSDGTTDWRVIGRRTFAVAVMQYVGTTTTQTLTTTPVKIDAWNTNGLSTPGRIIADQANNVVGVLNIQNSFLDAYEVVFALTFRYANSVDLDFTAYVNGVATTVGAPSVGKGAGTDVHVSFNAPITVLASGGTPQDIEVRASVGSGSNTITYNTGMILTAQRSGG